MEKEFISLYELQMQMRESVEDSFPAKLWVKAEIASVQVKANGHCYLELSQSEQGKIVARARAVIWRSTFLPLSVYFKEATGDNLKEGIEVLVRVQMAYSEIYGLTLVIDEIEPLFTLGATELERQRTIEKLTADGVMDKQKRLEPAQLPCNLAVISAQDAAGFGDFKRHLTENEYGFTFSVQLFEAAMQGKDAPLSISDALARIESSGLKYDAILILRGGGASLDLACFNDYGLCLAIAGCSIPVYTAIGHDKDYHVADMVAYDFVKTPTALADLFISALAAEDERITSLVNRLRISFISNLSSKSSALDILESRIRNADPRTVLSRGYTLVIDSRGVVMKSALNAKKGEQISIMFMDGTITAKVK